MAHIDGLRWAELLEGLTQAQVADLRSNMKDVDFAPRAVLFQQGAASDTVFVLSKGRVRLSIISEGGDEFSPNLVDRGGVLGLAAALLHKPRIVTAAAVEFVNAQAISIAAIERQMLSIPVFGRNIARLLATYTVEHVARSGFLALDSATGRLARILAACAGTNEQGREGDIVGLTHEDLARMVGASRTWVTLTLAEFERKGLITRAAGTIHIVDTRSLARCSSR